MRRHSDAIGSDANHLLEYSREQQLRTHISRETVFFLKIARGEKVKATGHARIARNDPWQVLVGRRVESRAGGFLAIAAGRRVCRDYRASCILVGLLSCGYICPACGACTVMRRILSCKSARFTGSSEISTDQTSQPTRAALSALCDWPIYMCQRPDRAFPRSCDGLAALSAVVARPRSFLPLSGGLYPCTTYAGPALR